MYFIIEIYTRTSGGAINSAVSLILTLFQSVFNSKVYPNARTKVTMKKCRKNFDKENFDMKYATMIASIKGAKLSRSILLSENLVAVEFGGKIYDKMNYL